MFPDDQTLTEKGFRFDGDGRLLIIACGALAREILSLIHELSLKHIELHCLPAILHNTPEKIPDAVAEAVEKARSQERYSGIFIGYADCGTGGLLQKRADELGVEMLEGPHCYSFFEGNAAFSARAEDEMQAFYLTDFLARQFDAFVIQPLGLDRHPQLRDMYFGNYTKVVYQAQTEDPELTKKAEEAAKRLGLDFERRFTGYGDLRLALKSFVQSGI